jgi:hypothetical protein
MKVNIPVTNVRGLIQSINMLNTVRDFIKAFPNILLFLAWTILIITMMEWSMVIPAIVIFGLIRLSIK